MTVRLYALWSVVLLAGLAACQAEEGMAAPAKPSPGRKPVGAAGPDAAVPSHRDYRVCLLPMGPHDARLLAVAERAIPALYDFPVETLDPVELPEAAWYPKRKRWRADEILTWLDASGPRKGKDGDCDAMVAFTKEDISTTKDEHEDWGILGLGQIGGRSAVVSTYRLGRALGKKGKSARARTIAERTAKVVNHELGHVLGMPHDATPGCIMNDAGGTVTTVDTENGLLCDDSRRTIKDTRGFDVPARSELDWNAIAGE